MSTIKIDGRTFTGRSVSIINNRVTIDGVEQDGTLSGVVEIRVLDGSISELRCDASVTCGAVTGGVTAGGSISCASVGGNVNAGGSVSCGSVRGSVRAGGSVSRA